MCSEIVAAFSWWPSTCTVHSWWRSAVGSALDDVVGSWWSAWGWSRALGGSVGCQRREVRVSWSLGLTASGSEALVSVLVVGQAIAAPKRRLGRTDASGRMDLGHGLWFTIPMPVVCKIRWLMVAVVVGMVVVISPSSWVQVLVQSFSRQIWQPSRWRSSVSLRRWQWCSLVGCFSPRRVLTLILRREALGPFGAAALGASMVGVSTGTVGRCRRPLWSCGGPLVSPASMGEAMKAWSSSAVASSSLECSSFAVVWLSVAVRLSGGYHHSC
jgi:hypothetical protein